MKYLAPRTAFELPPDPCESMRGEPRSIADYRDKAAYVLLGDPGIGKTTTFRQEADATANGCYISARNFVYLEPKPEWNESVLFIDGLDEIRAGNKDGRIVLDKLRSKLDQLGNPGFRISCRSANWYGSNDRKHLSTSSSDGNISVLMLAPLSELDIDGILENNFEISDRNVLLKNSTAAGIGGLFSNPLNLELVAKVSKAGHLPSSRLELMEWACHELLKERNEEHQYSQQELPDIARLLEQASHLSALLILTGSVGYSINQGLGSGYVDLREVTAVSKDLRRAVLSSRLFSVVAEGLFEPFHRHPIEYLAAWYVTGQVNNGLPLDRIVSLIVGKDGTVQSVFHGFVAWLSELSAGSRRKLIGLAPIAIVSSADLRLFHPADKQELLNALLRATDRNPSSESALLENRNLGSLVSTDTDQHIVKLVTDLVPSESLQPRALVLAEVLNQAPRIRNVVQPLLTIVRDSGWSRHVRLRALRAAVTQLGTDTLEALGELLQLAKDINNGLVGDDFNDLVGFALPRLYPQTLKPPAIVQYLHTPPSQDTRPAMSYTEFWRSGIKNLASAADLAELLDALVGRYNELFKWDKRTAQTVLEVLVIVLGYFLQKFGKKETPEHLFGWVGTAAIFLDSRTYDFGYPGAESEICNFLELNSDLQSELARLYTEQPRGKSGSDLDPLRFLNAELQALDTIDSGDIRRIENPIRSFIEQEQPAAYSIGHENQEASLRGTEENTNAAFVPARDLTDIGRQVLAHLAESIGDVDADDKPGTGKIPPDLLHRIAAVYYGIGEEAHGLTPMNRLRNFLGDEQAVIENVLHEFREVAAADVPDELQIISLTKQNILPWLALPCLAGLSLITDMKWRNEAQIRRAIAVYFSTHHLIPSIGNSDPPHWFSGLLDKHSDSVAKVYIKYAEASWYGSKLPPSELANLIHSDKYRTIARLIILPLLVKLSVRSSHIYSLMNLLHGAIRLRLGEEFISIVESKMSSTTMTKVQQVWWLAAGLWAAPTDYAQPLEAFVKGSQRSSQHLIKAIRFFESAGTRQIPPEALGVLIRLIAPLIDPPPAHGPNRLVHQGSGQLVARMIQVLRDWPIEEASQELERLAKDASLSQWHPIIDSALSAQLRLVSNWSFQYADMNRAAKVLVNGAPSNARDLAGLTTHVLKDLARQIRSGHTSDWRQYWNVDSYSRPKTPKPETSCRDALASDLRAELSRLDISVHIESVHSADNRSDILICYENYKIPVETKRSCSREAFSAIQTQLIAKYCIDPDSYGFGIYVVFWFGHDPKCRPTKTTGLEPRTAEELEAHLTDSLPEAEKHRISIVVIDVAKPE